MLAFIAVNKAFPTMLFLFIYLYLYVSNKQLKKYQHSVCL